VAEIIPIQEVLPDLQKDSRIKMNWWLAENIRQRIAEGEKQSDLAKEFGVTRNCISMIARKRTWVARPGKPADKAFRQYIATIEGHGVSHDKKWYVLTFKTCHGQFLKSYWRNDKTHTQIRILKNILKRELGIRVRIRDLLNEEPECLIGTKCRITTKPATAWVSEYDNDCKIVVEKILGLEGDGR